MRDINGIPVNHSADSNIDNQLRWATVEGNVVAFTTTAQGTTATIGGQPATLPAPVQAITVVNNLYLLARRHPIQARQEETGWSVYFLGPRYVEENRNTVFIADGCGSDSCTSASCGAQGSAVGTCLAQTCGGQGGVAGACDAQACGADVCGSAACATNACGANACFADLGILPCPAEACFANLGIPECPFIL